MLGKRIFYFCSGGMHLRITKLMQHAVESSKKRENRNYKQISKQLRADLRIEQKNYKAAKYTRPVRLNQLRRGIQLAKFLTLKFNTIHLYGNIVQLTYFLHAITKAKLNSAALHFYYT